MTRLGVPSSLLCFTLVLSVLPTVLAGPACASRNQSKEGCVKACSQKWGWSGMAMGSDPWGPVMKPVPTSDGLDIAQAKACKTRTPPPAAAAGSPPPTATSTEGPATPSGTQPPPISAILMTSTTLASSASTTLTSSSKHRTTSSSKAPEPKTSSTPPTPSTTNKPSPKPTVTQGSSGGPSGDEIGQYLDAHNGFRAQHGAKPLTWSDELASKAQEWANQCNFQHSGGTLGPFGENLAAGNGNYNIAEAVQGWKDEARKYNPNNPQPSHFTQVVWKGSTQLGCAHAQCDGIFPASFGKATFHVCEYQAQGNIIGKFAENVQA